MASTRSIDGKASMAKNNNNGKIINSQAVMNKAIKSICDILRRDKAKGARLYVPELTWMFFLRYLDLMEFNAEQRAKALGTPFQATLEAPYRWRDWGAPYDIKVPYEQAMEQKLPGWKRRELSEQPMGAYLSAGIMAVFTGALCSLRPGSYLQNGS